jgi:hypothetical protein
MSLENAHRYFLECQPERWGILGFLNMCSDDMTFGRKLDVYTKSLEALKECEDGKKRSIANSLIDRFRDVSECF